MVLVHRGTPGLSITGSGGPGYRLPLRGKPGDERSVRTHPAQRGRPTRRAQGLIAAGQWLDEEAPVLAPVALPLLRQIVLVVDRLDRAEADYPGSYGWDYLERGPVWRIRISRLSSTALPRILADTSQLISADGGPGDAAGAVWKLQLRQRDLDSNVIRLHPGSGIDSHLGPDLDVLLLVLDGSGQLGTERGSVDLWARRAGLAAAAVPASDQPGPGRLDLSHRARPPAGARAQR
jgi:hypothetical protein